MRLHRVAEDEVGSCIANPRWQEDEGDGHTYVAWIPREGLYLKVVYSAEDGDEVVITVGLRDRLPEGLQE